MKRFITKRDFIILFFAIILWCINYFIFPFFKAFAAVIFSLEDGIPFISVSTLIKSVMIFLISWIGFLCVGQRLQSKLKLKMPVLKLLVIGIFTSMLGSLISYFVILYTMDLVPSSDATRWEFSKLLGPPGTNIIFFFLFLVPVAISEEIFFRGLCYDGFRDRHSFILTLLVNNLIFLAFHPYPEMIPVYFIGNTFVCVVYEYCKSLPLMMLIHLLHNSDAFFGLWPF